MRLLAKRTLAIFLSVLMVLSVMMAGAATAFAAETTDLFLSVNSEWAIDGARFAAYFYIDETTNTWASMTAVEGKENLYTVAVPEGDWTNVIFCRMNPDTTDNSWDDGVKWNQTGNIAMPTEGNNCFTLDAGWDGTGVWGVYSAESGEVTTQPTEPAAPVENTYTVAGVSGLCGSEWDVADTNNNMTNNGDGTYIMVYANVPAGSYQFKVVTNHDWNNPSYGDPNGPEGNFQVVVNTSATITITFDANTGTVTYTKDGDSEPVAVEGEIYFVNTVNWDVVNGHHWNANGGLNMWPGDYATLVEGNVYSFNVTGATGIVFNCNGGAQTGNIDITADVIGKYYEPKTNAFYATAEEANAAADVPAEPVESNYVYFVNTVDWYEVNVHCWGGSVNTSWPGNAATLVEGTENVYVFDIGNSTNFLFNCNGDESKTGDLNAADGINKYFEPKTSAFYDTAEAAIEASNNAEMVYFVVGTAGIVPGVGEWDNTIRPETTMVKGEDGIYKLVCQGVAAGYYEVKVKDTLGKWYPEGINTETEITVLEDNAEVIITFDPAVGYCEATVTGQESVPVNYVLVGYINGKDLGIGEDKDTVPYGTLFQDSVLTYEFTEDSYVQVKTTNNKKFYGTAVCVEGETSAVFMEDGAEKMKVPAGKYTFTLIVNADNTLTVSYVPAVEEPSTEEPSTEAPTTEPTTKPAAKTTITLKSTKATVYVTGTTTIKATVKNGKGKTTYTTSNKKVATVNASGKVTAKKAGTAKITVANNGVKKTFTVTVKNPKLNKTKATLKKNKTLTLKVTGLVGKAKFTTSSKKIATVSSKGKITAKKKGTATITVTANGMKLKCKVTVK